MRSELSIFASHYKVGKVNIHLVLVNQHFLYLDLTDII